MAITFTFLDSGGGEPPLVTDTAYNPATAAALAVLIGINGSSAAQVTAPTGCKATWTRKAEFSMGDWGTALYLGTGATTNEAITFTTSGDSFGFQYMVVQISADGTLSFPANDSEATGSGATGTINLSAFADAANRSLSMWWIETGDGTTPGTNHTELFDAFLVGLTGFAQYSTSADTSVDCTFTSGTWGGGAFEVAEAAAGGTINTQTLSSAIDVADQPLDYVFFNRRLESSASLSDQLLGYLLRNRFLEDAVTVTEGPTVISTTYQYTATDELTVLDELIRSILRNALLTDQITVTDTIIADLIGYLIYTQVMTSNVTVSDDALVYRLFNRQLDDSLLTDDQVLRALLVARDLLDGVEVTDSSLTAMQRFILLTDTLMVDDSLTALYVPVVGPATDNPIIRIGFDQPQITFGGYGLH